MGHAGRRGRVRPTVHAAGGIAVRTDIHSALTWFFAPPKSATPKWMHAHRMRTLASALTSLASAITKAAFVAFLIVPGCE